MSGELPHADQRGAGRLKYVRNRSLRNPHWRRDPDYLNRFLTQGDLRWSSPSILEPELLSARSSVSRYMAQSKKGKQSDEAWLAVLGSVDALLSRADELNGTKIPGRAI